MTYVTLEDFKEYRNVNRSTDVADDALLQAALDAAHAGINDYLQRNLTVATTASDRTYTPSWSDTLRIHDCTTIVSVTDNGAAVASTGWQSEPTFSWSGQVRPIEQIRRWTGWWGTGYQGQRTITVNATWGWAAIPPEAVEACKILAKDILANRELNFGIASFEAYGLKAGVNPQVVGLIADLRRVEAFGIA